MDVIDFCDRLPAKPKFQEIAGQLRRAANGVAANYRAAWKMKSYSGFSVNQPNWSRSLLRPKKPPGLARDAVRPISR